MGGFYRAAENAKARSEDLAFVLCRGSLQGLLDHARHAAAAGIGDGFRRFIVDLDGLDVSVETLLLQRITLRFEFLRQITVDRLVRLPEDQVRRQQLVMP